MTDKKKSGDDDAETQALEVEAQTVENENGEVIDSPTVNAYVVGVSLLGPGDPQSAKTKD